MDKKTKLTLAELLKGTNNCSQKDKEDTELVCEFARCDYYNRRTGSVIVS